MAPTKRLARSSNIEHPSGAVITTPLLVPSFSSKGFGFNKKNESEITDIFKVADEFLVNSMLVSAYDIHYGHIPKLDSISTITIVDSGGYETSDVHDASTVFRNPVNPNPWNEELLKKVYEDWSPVVPAVFVNYDQSDLRRPFGQQIQHAEDFFAQYPNQLHTLLLKPEKTSDRYIDFAKLGRCRKGLNAFDIIGLTEKELGDSILERMKNLAELRLSLDSAGVEAPLHIFGSLDPITTPLYFLAGAEIFDGLTWLRFGYHQGSATYVHNAGALAVGIDKRESTIKSRILWNNYSYLADLQYDMRKFLLAGDFKMFSNNAQFFKKAYDLLKTEVEELN